MALGNPLPLLLSTVGDYEIERSLRLAAESSACYHRTWSGDDANLQKQTYSFWIKRTTIDTAHYMFTAWNNSNTDRIGFTSDNQFFIELKNGGSTEAEFHSDRVFRDPSAWMHVVVAFDTTDGTTDNRMKAYINNELITDWDTKDTIGQNYSMTGFGKAGQQHVIGAYASSNTDRASFFDGYMADFYFIDGQQLTPSSFGEENADTGQWVPIKYTGTYGSKGWYINFSDNSDTTELGKDSSGNSQNFTPDNISVAAGVGNDSLEDTPTNNFPTFNPLNGRPSYWGTFTNGSLDLDLPNGSYAQFGSTTMCMKSGKWYWEITIEDSGSNAAADSCMVGVSEPYAPWTSQNPTYKRRHYMKTGQKITGDADSNTTASYGASYTDGDVIGVALDLDAGTLTMYKNGSTQGVLDTTMTSAMSSNGWNPDVHGYATPNFNINFGQRAFAHTPPTGHKKLCTANLPTPTIKKGSDYFNTVLYTGTSSSRTVSVGFAPNLTWIKKRNSAENHEVQDTVRGATKRLASNTTDAEATVAGSISAFTSDGFTVVDAGTTNENTHTYVAWNWKESASAGFDIVSYTGTGNTPQTRAHSLGVAPEMMIVKSRSGTDGDEHWVTYHHKGHATPQDYFGRLNTTAAWEDNTIWNDTAPTSSVFTTANNAIINNNGDTYIAYLFASVEGYSKVDSYVGNGNADGTYVHIGFRPAFVLIKSSSNAEAWNIFDNKRDPDNKVHHLLAPNTNTEENNSTAARELDFLSNGFKMRGTNDTINGSGKTYIYLAFAERPFKYANAR